MLSRVLLPLVGQHQSVPIEVTLAPGFAPTERFVHGDVVDSSGGLVAAFQLPLKKDGEGWVARGRFDAPAWGTTLVTLFCAARGGDDADGAPSPRNVGVLTTGLQIPVQPNHALSVALRVPTTARQGQRISISGWTTDARGKSRAASIGASVVDSEILSLFDPLTMPPGDYYYDPARKVLATTGAKRLTWPVLARTWGSDRDNIAVPPFGFVAADPDWRPDVALEPSRADESVGGAEKTTEPLVFDEVSEREEPTRAPSITVRTGPGPDPVALWIAESEAPGGRFRFDVDLPQGIAHHVVTVVASDDAGRVGVGRAEITASPATLVDTDAGARTDEAAHPEDVPPAAMPRVTTYAGQVTRAETFEHRWTAAAGAGASVSVILPGAARALEFVDSVTSDPDAASMAPGAAATLAYHLARYLGGYDALTAERWAPLRDAVVRDLIRIGIAGQPDGGHLHPGTGQPSAIRTGRALEGLTAARTLMLAVPQESLSAAGGFILRGLDENGLVDGEDAGWWQGPARARRMALTAELFRIIAEAGPDAIPLPLRGRFEHMRETVARRVNLSSDPLALAQAGLGLIAYEANFMGGQLDGRRGRRLLRRILEERRQGHWEPSWFQADSGTVAATVGALELAALLDPQSTASLVRDAMIVVDIARRRLNGGDTAAAAIATVRALAALPAVPAETEAPSVVVELNGRQVRQVDIDPADPYTAALPLARVDLSEYLQSGENVLRVSYSGEQIGRAVLQVRSDGRPETTPPPE